MPICAGNEGEDTQSLHSQVYAATLPSVLQSFSPQKSPLPLQGRGLQSASSGHFRRYPSVGIAKWFSSRMPLGQREVMVFICE
jgi:hypothetical protein